MVSLIMLLALPLIQCDENKDAIPVQDMIIGNRYVFNPEDCETSNCVNWVEFLNQNQVSFYLADNAEVKSGTYEIDNLQIRIYHTDETEPVLSFQYLNSNTLGQTSIFWEERLWIKE